MTQGKDRFRTIPTKNLLLGMYIHDVGRSWLKQPWLTRKKLITSNRDIQTLLDYGIDEVVIDLSLGVNPSEAVDPGRPKRPDPDNLEGIERREGARPEEQNDIIPLEEEIPAVRKAYYYSIGKVKFLVSQVQHERPMDISLADRVVDEIIESVFRNRDAFLTLLKIRRYEKYEFSHPMLVTVLALSFGRYLGMSKEQLRPLGLGAMLQDIGKTRIPNRILRKPGALDPAEFEIIKKHSTISALMLKELPEITPQILNIARHHHERTDGSGYPRGLPGDKLTPYVIIGGLADVFDALTTNKVYRKGRSPYEALKMMFQMRGQRFPAVWVDRFIHCLGIYPPGTVVQLNTGELAVVTAVNHSQLLRPRIKLVTDSQKRPIPRIRKIDLNNENQVHRSVKTVVDPHKYGIEPIKYVDPNYQD